jgi:hypothetical protein
MKTLSRVATSVDWCRTVIVLGQTEGKAPLGLFAASSDEFVA